MAALLMSPFSMLSITAEGESVFLSDLLLAEPNRMVEYSGWEILQDGKGGFLPGLNTDCAGNPIYMYNKYYEKGVGTHSAELLDDSSYLEINIEGLGYEYFTALVGMVNEMMPQEVERNRAAFIVEVDGTEVKKTDFLTYDSEPVEISVSVKGAKRLTLALDPGDTRYSDNSIWANAKLSNDPAVDKTASDTPVATQNPLPTAPPIEDNMIYLSDYLRNNPDKKVKYTGWAEEDEEPFLGLDCTYDGMALKLYGSLYAKGIGMHSNASLDEETVLEIDIKDAGFTKFTALIGMYDTNWPQEVERNVASFIVLVDGKKAYESDIMYYNSEPETVEVNLAGASTLTLQLDPNLTANSDSAIWANALLISDSTVATPTPAPTATPVKTTAPTAKPTATKAVSTQKVTETDGLSTKWIVIIIVAAVVVVGAVIAVILILKKKKKNDVPKA